MPELTERQRQIAALVGDGLSNKQIAYQLGLAEGTVKLHVHNVLKALGASSRYALIAVMLRGTR